MIKNPFVLQVGEETIAGISLHNSVLSASSKFVFLHGAGTSAKELINNVAEPIVKNGVSVFAIDFSGHGQSTGELKKSSLKKRVIEAQALINQVVGQLPLIICGASMGGYIAMKMLELYNIDTLISFCLALYDGRAYDIHFDQGFTQIIRTHKSWRNTDVLSTLEAFTGKLLVIMGEKDDVIPSGVITLIDRHTPNVNKKEIYTISNCPHKINLWITDYHKELIKLQRKILEYLV